MEDAPRSGLSIKANDDNIKALVEADRQITTREIAEKLKLSNLTDHDHLKHLEFISKAWHLGSPQVKGNWVGSTH